jgi:hypothetical protein
MKTINIFGRAVPIAVLAIIATVGIASAALLTQYASLSASITVSQSVTLTSCYYYDNGWHVATVADNSCSIIASSVGGNYLDVLLAASNGASVGVPTNVASSSPYSSEYTVTYWGSHDGNGCTGSALINPITIPASSTQDFCLRYTFLPNAVGTYPITETVSPV